MPRAFLLDEGMPRFLTPKEVACLLRLSLSSVYRLVEARQIPFHRLSGSLRFLREDVEAFIADGRIGSSAKMNMKNYECEKTS